MSEMQFELGGKTADGRDYYLSTDGKYYKVDDVVTATDGSSAGGGGGAGGHGGGYIPHLPEPLGYEAQEADLAYLREAQALNEALSREGLGIAEDSFNQAMGLQQPFVGNLEGFNSLKQGVLKDEFSANNDANSFTFDPSDPEYQQLMQQGTNAINTAASAQGLAHSGAKLKDLNRFGQMTANQYATDILNRRRAIAGDRYTQLGALANIEQTAANNLSNLHTGYGQLAAGTLSGLGSGALNAGQLASQMATRVGLANASNQLTAQQLANNFAISQQQLANNYDISQQQMGLDGQRLDLVNQQYIDGRNDARDSRHGSNTANVVGLYDWWARNYGGGYK